MGFHQVPKSILIAGAGANQIGIITKARELGMHTIAMDGDAGAEGFKHADIAVCANILDADTLEEMGKLYNINGIYPAAELAVEAVAEAAQRLNLPCFTPLVANRCRHKAAMRRALEFSELPNPVYREAFTLAEARDCAVGIGFPLIIKPVDANSSKGVQRLESLDELHEAFDHAMKHSRADTVLLEEFMEGEEYCVDGLVNQGQYISGGITGKERSELPHRFDTGIYMPPRLNQAELDIIETCAYNALKSIGFAHGTFHIEIIVTEEGPRIVEIAGRPGGGRIPTDLIPLAYGMDFMADSLRITLGEDPISTRHHERGAALFWLSAQPGTVTAISGVDEARALPGVQELVLNTHPSDIIVPTVDCVARDAIGYVLCDGDSHDQAIQHAKAACATCTIHTA